MRHETALTKGEWQEALYASYILDSIMSEVSTRLVNIGAGRYQYNITGRYKNTMPKPLWINRTARA